MRRFIHYCIDKKRALARFLISVICDRVDPSIFETN